MSTAAGPNRDRATTDRDHDHGIDLSIHVLTRIGLQIHHEGDARQFSIPAAPVLLDDDGHVNFGVLGVFLDMAASQPPEMHARGHFVHADITIHRLRRPNAGRLVATAQATRMGRRSGVIEMDLHDESGVHVARSVQEVVFPAASPPAPVGNGVDARAEFFARLVGECTLDRPLNDSVGVAREANAEGVPRWTIPLLNSNRNGFGGLHGGVATALVDAAAAGAAAHATGQGARTVSAAVRYLSPSLAGPFRAIPEVLRADEASALVVVRVQDTGAQNRTTIVADVAVELDGRA